LILGKKIFNLNWIYLHEIFVMLGIKIHENNAECACIGSNRNRFSEWLLCKCVGYIYFLIPWVKKPLKSAPVMTALGRKAFLPVGKNQVST
jgi:hypothetical protein